MDLTENDLLRMYRKIAEIRVFEKGLTKFYEDGLLVGNGYPSTDEEAVAVGACSVVRKEDYTMSTRRPHGHILSKRVPMHIVLTKLFGRTTGCTGGRVVPCTYLTLNAGFSAQVPSLEPA
jgi:TPP-dependent pyruvate/acetoin dehydrogenase alpha subunit